MPEPSAFEFELATGKLKNHNSPGIDQIPAELIKAGGRTICGEIHKLIISYLYWRITKFVTPTAAFKQLGVLPPPRPQSPVPRSNTPPVDTTDDHHFPTMLPTQPPVQQSTSPPASFGHVVASGPQPVDLAAQLSTFLNEFNSLFTQLMQQTGAILSMLTAVLPRLTN